MVQRLLSSRYVRNVTRSSLPLLALLLVAAATWMLRGR